MRLWAALALVAASSLIPSAAQTTVSASAALQWQVLTLAPPAPPAPFSYAEPGIVISPDGTALAVAATANTGPPPTVWLSHDDGSSWSSGQDFDTTGASTGDADAALGADGYLYTLDVGFNSNPPTNPTVLVFRSRDGVTWQGPASFPPPHGLDQPDRPWLFTDPNHSADVFVVNSEVGGNIVVWRSQDHGASFAGPVPATGGANSQAALALSSRPLFDPTNDQRVFMLYETVTPAGLAATIAAAPPVYEFPMTQMWLAVSTDAGATWSNHVVLDTAALAGSAPQGGTLGHLLTASAVDSMGNIYAAFSLRRLRATETNIYVIHSMDHGVTWSDPAEVTTATRSNVMPALAVGGNGAVYLSWYGSADSDFRSTSATWFEMFAASVVPLAAQPDFVVNQVTSAPVHVGGIDTAGTIGSDLGANWGLRDFQSIAVDGCDRPHPAWAVDDGRQATQTAVPVTSCAAVGPSGTVAETPWVGLLLLPTGAALFLVSQRRRRRRGLLDG